MPDVDEIRQLISESQSRVERDMAALQKLTQRLSYTRSVIERATLAYVASVRTLDKIEQLSSNARLSAPNPPPPRASPLVPSDF